MSSEMDVITLAESLDVPLVNRSAWWDVIPRFARKT